MSRLTQPLKLAVFGGSGFVGKILLSQALEAGHSIKVLVRTPGKLGELGAQVEVVQGNLFDPQAVRRTVQGCDALLSCAGPTIQKSKAWTQTDYVQAMESVAGILPEEGIQRFIVLASAGTRIAGHNQGWKTKGVQLFMRSIFPTMIYTKEEEMKALAASDLDWTILRPPLIKEFPATHKLRLHGSRLPGFRISVADLAAEMLRQLDSEEWSRKAPFLS